jgi:hypothetical protein
MVAELLDCGDCIDIIFDVSHIKFIRSFLIKSNDAGLAPSCMRPSALTPHSVLKHHPRISIKNKTAG